MPTNTRSGLAKVAAGRLALLFVLVTAGCSRSPAPSGYPQVNDYWSSGIIYEYPGVNRVEAWGLTGFVRHTDTYEVTFDGDVWGDAWYPAYVILCVPALQAGTYSRSVYDSGALDLIEMGFDGTGAGCQELTVRLYANDDCYYGTVSGPTLSGQFAVMRDF